MAYLINTDSEEHIYLNAHHLFGRLAYSVNTVLGQPEVSRIHAVIEWSNDVWKLRDFGKNGTWINQHKVDKGRAHSLSKGDILNFGTVDSNRYVVADLSQPQDTLVAVEDIGQLNADVIQLNNYNLLPNSDAPECALFLKFPDTTWCLETIGDSKPPVLLKENDLVNFSGRRWQLKLNRAEAETREVGGGVLSLDNIEFIFNLSMDEERTTLSLQTPNGTINLDARIHHYLTLNLARYKAESMNYDQDETEKGWVYTEQLAKDLGLTETYINIQIHRARKQFANALNARVNSEHFIQRRSGKIRLGAPTFKVYKGNKLECALSGNATSNLN